jgi:hypothetical protein
LAGKAVKRKKELSFHEGVVYLSSKVNKEIFIKPIGNEPSIWGYVFCNGIQEIK